MTKIPPNARWCKPPTNVMKIRAKNRRQYQLRKAKGKCTTCASRDAMPGRTRCVVCSKAHSRCERARQVRLEPIQKKLGICIYCDSREAMPGSRACGACQEYRMEATARWRQARISAHECIDCGVPALAGRRRCPGCLERNRVQQRETRARKAARRLGGAA